MAMYPCLSLPSLSFPTLTGSIVTFNSQYAGLPLKSHTVALTATQSGSGTPSPDNVRSINGYSAINIQRIANNEVISTIPSAGIDSTGKIIADVRFFLIIAPITSGINYVMNNSDTQFVYAFYSDMPAGGSQSYDTNRVVNTNNQFNAPINGYVAVRVNAGVSDYSICKGNAYSITIGSTVYGGEYDARTGVLTVTHEIVEMSTISYNAGFGGYYTGYYANTIKVPDTAANSELMCSCFDVGNTAGGDNLFIQPTGSSYPGYIIILPSATYQDANAFRNSLQGQFFVYPLKTPTKIQLQPCPIDTLLGENNIWADTGDTTLQYIKLG